MKLALLLLATVGPAPFVDAGEYFRSKNDEPTWASLQASVRRAFDDVCGDTFCETDFDYKALDLTCAVESSTGAIHACRWPIVGTKQDVDSETGAVIVDSKLVVCDIHLTGGIELFAHQMSSEPLPSGVYEDLVLCLVRAQP